MPDGRFAILDPIAGISGDMVLGALLAAGASPEWLHSLPARLGLPDVTIHTTVVERCGVRAMKVDVRLPGGLQEQPSVGVPSLEHDHAHHTHDDSVTPSPQHGPHRHVGELIAIIERAPLSAWVRERAVRAFRLLG